MSEQREIIIIAMFNSWLKNMQARIYFPFFSLDEKNAIKSIDLPELDYKDNGNSIINQLHKALGEDASIVEWFMFPDRKAIEELFLPSPIDGHDSVSLFEASIMIGSRLLRSECNLLFDSKYVFTNAILNGEIDPRHPMSLIRLSQLPNGIPDLDWRLYPDELQDFTVKVWGIGVYTQEELDSGQPLDAQQDQQIDRSLPTNKTLYRIISALSKALAEAYPDTLQKDGAPFVGYSKDTGNSGIVGHLSEKGFSDLKTRCLENHIKEALKNMR